MAGAGLRVTEGTLGWAGATGAARARRDARKGTGSGGGVSGAQRLGPGRSASLTSRRCPGGRAAVLTHAPVGASRPQSGRPPPPPRRPALLWVGAVWGQACDVVKDRLRSWRSAASTLPTRRRQSSARPESFPVSRGLFFEETEDYIFYREQAVFLIFVSFFRCNFYLCSNPNLPVWGRSVGPPA